MKFGERPKQEPEIPTCSMADIAFLLVIFFMLTTVFRAEKGIRVTLPLAKATKKLPARNIAHIWISTEGLISINDNIIKMNYVSPIMQKKVTINPNLIVSILMDKDSEYSFLADIFEQLRTAKALKVSLATLKEKGG